MFRPIRIAASPGNMHGGMTHSLAKKSAAMSKPASTGASNFQVPPACRIVPRTYDRRLLASFISLSATMSYSPFPSWHRHLVAGFGLFGTLPLRHVLRLKRKARIQLNTLRPRSQNVGHVVKEGRLGHHDAHAYGAPFTPDSVSTTGL